MQRISLKIAPLIVGAVLLLLAIALPAIAGDPDPPFQEIQTPELALSANLGGMRVAPDATIWIIDNGHQQLVKWILDCTPGVADNCANYFDFMSDPFSEYGWTLAFFDDDENTETYRVYVTQPGGNKVSIFDQDGVFIDDFGTFGDGDGQFNTPTGIAVDSDGFVYVSDSANHRVQVFDADGVWQTTWAYPFENPKGMWYDPEEDLVYVVDEQLYEVYIIRFNTAGEAQGVLLRIAETPATAGDITKYGDFVYMIEHNGLGSVHRREVALPDDDAFEVITGDFFLPSGIATWDNNTPDTGDDIFLLVDSQGGNGGQVRAFAGFDNPITDFDLTEEGTPAEYGDGRWSTRGSEPGFFNHANGIAVGSDGRRYVVDGYNRRIQVFGADGAWQTQWTHPWDLSGPDDPAWQDNWEGDPWPGNFDGSDGPRGIDIGDDGAVYVADPTSHTMIYFPPNYDGGASDPVIWYATPGGPETYVYAPWDIAVHGNRIYVTDQYSEYIHVYDKAPGTATSSADFTYVGTWHVPVEVQPWSIAVDPVNDIVYFTTIDGNIWAYEAGTFPPFPVGEAGELIFGENDFNYFGDLVVDNEGQLWAADTGTHRVAVLSVDLDTRQVTIVNIIGKLGGDEGEFYSPQGIEHDSEDGLYVADGINHRYQVFGVLEEEPTPTATATDTPLPTSTPTLGPTATPTTTPEPTTTFGPGEFNPPTAIPTGAVPPTIAAVAPTATPPPGSTNTPLPAGSPTNQAIGANPNTGGAAQVVSETPGVSPTAAASTPTAAGSTPAPTATQGVSATPAPSGPAPEARPELFNEVLDARDISTTPEVLAANAILSVILLLLLLDASIFNSTIKENEEVIIGFVGGLFAPLKALQNAWTGSGGESLVGRIGKPLSVLGLSALVYSLLEPDLKFDTSTLVLFVSLLLGIGIATYVYEGAQVVISERFFNLDSAIRFYPVAILIAVVSVGFSKITGLHPGLVYGFVAGAALMAHREPDKREAGLIIFLPMIAMIAVSLISWLLLAPLRSWSEDGSILALILEGAALSLFLGGIQGLLFTLVPLPFMDGEKVWQWNKIAWAALVFPVGFLFFHVVINQEGTLREAIDEHGVTALVVLAAASWGMTIVTWALFRWRRAVSPS